ncbi:MAG: phosphate/phosphite/phosphonate ABC transporter substrate-binding protein [Alphaproteobacteria bacterium]|jgi:phosphonate transport system substrate-binding protein
MKRRSLIAALATLPIMAHAQSRDPQRLRVALLPDENASTIIQNAQPLRAHLERTLSRQVEIVVTTDYSSMIEAMRFGRIEVAYFGPFSYVLAKSRAPGIEPFAVGVERGSPTYQSVMIAQAGGPVRELADIRGRPLGFGDQASTSSHLVPRATILQRAGLIGGRDYRVVHLGTHDAVARAVQGGQVPAGALSKPILDTLVRRGTIDATRVIEIGLSEPIPNYPMVLQGNLSDALKAAIRSAFLDLRETARLLELDLSQMRG